MELEQIARMFRRSVSNSWRNVLIGSPPPVVVKAYERMKAPLIGDLVVEITTVGGMRHENASDLDGIGILEEIAWEKVYFSDPEFVWDEAVAGQSHPLEKVYYIRTFDDRRFRWVNASMIAVLTEY